MKVPDVLVRSPCQYSTLAYEQRKDLGASTRSLKNYDFTDEETSDFRRDKSRRKIKCQKKRFMILPLLVAPEFWAAFYAGLRGMTVNIIESLSELSGGQPCHSLPWEENLRYPSLSSKQQVRNWQKTSWLSLSVLKIVSAFIWKRKFKPLKRLGWHLHNYY